VNANIKPDKFKAPPLRIEHYRKDTLTVFYGLPIGSYDEAMVLQEALKDKFKESPMDVTVIPREVGGRVLDIAVQLPGKFDEVPKFLTTLMQQAGKASAHEQG